MIFIFFKPHKTQDILLSGDPCVFLSHSLSKRSENSPPLWGHPEKAPAIPLLCQGAGML